jgi:hypothetical protein
MNLVTRGLGTEGVVVTMGLGFNFLGAPPPPTGGLVGRVVKFRRGVHIGF